MSELTKLPNIGIEVARKLNLAGIQTGEELKALGAEQVFLRLKALDPGACFSMLCCLEGAIQGIRWHHISPERKMELKHFLNMVKNQNN